MVFHTFRGTIYGVLTLQTWKKEMGTGQKMAIDKSLPIYVFGDIKRSLYFKGGVEKRVG